MARRKTIEVFGLAFLDLICCGLGGVTVLMLIFSSIMDPQEKSNHLQEQQAAADEDPQEEYHFLALQVTVMGAPIDLSCEDDTLLVPMGSSDVDHEGNRWRKGNLSSRWFVRKDGKLDDLPNPLLKLNPHTSTGNIAWFIAGLPSKTLGKERVRLFKALADDAAWQAYIQNEQVLLSAFTPAQKQQMLEDRDAIRASLSHVELNLFTVNANRDPEEFWLIRDTNFTLNHEKSPMTLVKQEVSP